WLCTHLVAQDGGWGRADEIFEKHANVDGLAPIPDALYEALDTIKPFLDERGLVYLLGDRVATHATGEDGAAVGIPIANGPIFHAAQLRSLEKIATQINFAAYPQPCYFVGKKLRGVIVGVRG